MSSSLLFPCWSSAYFVYLLLKGGIKVSQLLLLNYLLLPSFFPVFASCISVFVIVVIYSLWTDSYHYKMSLLLLVFGLVCKELGSHPSTLTTSKTLNKLKTTLLRSITELRPPSKSLLQKRRDRQADTENHNLLEQTSWTETSPGNQYGGRKA